MRARDGLPDELEGLRILESRRLGMVECEREFLFTDQVAVADVLPRCVGLAEHPPPAPVAGPGRVGAERIRQHHAGLVDESSRFDEIRTKATA